ncbi:MAG: hypothetical protein U1C73_10700 [Dietzia sp.]|nr:hypothetical protein [Dietzia sp.]
MPAPQSGCSGRSRNGHASAVPRSWDAASAAGVADLARLVGLHPSDGVVLLGCCCGCRVIHDWLDAHPEQLDRVLAVGLLSDPLRPRDRWLPGTGDPGGQGWRAGAWARFRTGRSGSPFPATR